MPPFQSFDHERMYACCDVFARLEANVSTILNNSNDSSVIEKIQALIQSSTPESRLPNNVLIYNVKSASSCKRTPHGTESGINFKGPGGLRVLLDSAHGGGIQDVQRMRDAESKTWQQQDFLFPQLQPHR